MSGIETAGSGAAKMPPGARASTALALGIAAALLAASSTASAQSVRSLVHGGNDEYAEGKFTDAEVNYRKALEQEAELVQGHFNLGNALHKQGKQEEAVRQYEQAINRAVDAGTKANGYYNIGNSYLAQQKYREAAQAYVEGLKLKPDDADAKYNLSYALEMLKKQEDQQQQQEQDKNQNQNQKNQDNKNQQQNQQQPQPQEPPPRQQQPQQSRQQQQMSREQAQRILDVLKDSERDIQKKLRARQAVRPKGDKDW
jgi:tetratricopeptide (TPR) repeat protein